MIIQLATNDLSNGKLCHSYRPKGYFIFKLMQSPTHFSDLFLNSVLRLSSPIVCIGALNPITPKDCSVTKMVVLDILAVTARLLFNIEMQTRLPSSFVVV